MAIERAIRKGPRHTQFGNVASIDLVEGAVAGIGIITRLAAPLTWRIVGREIKCCTRDASLIAAVSGAGCRVRLRSGGRADCRNTQCETYRSCAMAKHMSPELSRGHVAQ